MKKDQRVENKTMDPCSRLPDDNVKKYAYPMPCHAMPSLSVDRMMLCRQSQAKEAGTKQARFGGSCSFEQKATTPAPAKKREHLSPHVTKTKRRGSLLCPPAVSFTSFWRELEIGTKVNNSGSRQKERAFISTCHKDQKKGILALASCLLLHLILAKVGDWNKSAHLRLLPKRESI